MRTAMDLISDLEKEIKAYKVAYDILMEYWDSLPDEAKPEIDEELKKVGL